MGIRTRWTSSSRLRLTALMVGSLLLGAALGPAVATATDKVQDVLVRNTPTEPVPVAAQGTTQVDVTNPQLGVNVQGGSLNISGGRVGLVPANTAWVGMVLVGSNAGEFYALGNTTNATTLSIEATSNAVVLLQNNDLNPHPLLFFEGTNKPETITLSQPVPLKSVGVVCLDSDPCQARVSVIGTVQP